MKLQNITPENFKCVAAACPAVYTDDEKDNVIIIGKKGNPEKMGLTEKVGEGESVVVMDKEILRKAVKSLD